ncbi:MAG: DUF748 domain-containing protein [Pseudohongiella sp.]|nr:DUF748 domain-containing protein [Pseudohongiella sp.]MDO9521485.1 DUF748 domain-containing protein [Pseudohongiella sp.]MDP2127755.1 DUF748 domain-containing protein [Pseudohongiella sp.]
MTETSRMAVEKPVQHQRRSRKQIIVTGIVVLVLILIGLRMALPTLMKDYLNRQMANMGDYRGVVADVDIALWRGAYSLHALNISKVDQDVPVPFFTAEIIDLAVSWGALLRGAVVAEVAFLSPTLHFVDGGDQESQDGSGTDWRMALQEITAININELTVTNGELHFHNFQSDPPVNLALTNLEGSFTNLSNVERRDTPIYANFNLSGRMLDTASASVSGNLDPLGDFRDFIIAMRITDIELEQLNDLTEAYGNFDFESGNGDFVMELQAEAGALTGYARPVLDNVAILDLESDSEKGLLNVVWESLVAAMGQIFRNQPADRIAADIDIRGDLNQQDVSTWQAFRSLIRNAFVEAYEAQFRP